MSTQTGFWERMQGELKTASERARQEAEKAVRMGVLRVDLVSLRRDRNRAHAHLGGRLLALWSAGSLDSLAQDGEVLRLKALAESIEGLIAAKEEELKSLRARPSETATPNP